MTDKHNNSSVQSKDKIQRPSFDQKAKDFGLTLDHIGLIAGMSKQKINYYKNHYKAGLLPFFKLSIVLDIPMEELFFEEYKDAKTEIKQYYERVKELYGDTERTD